MIQITEREHPQVTIHVLPPQDLKGQLEKINETLQAALWSINEENYNTLKPLAYKTHSKLIDIVNALHFYAYPECEVDPRISRIFKSLKNLSRCQDSVDIERFETKLLKAKLKKNVYHDHYSLGQSPFSEIVEKKVEDIISENEKKLLSLKEKQKPESIKKLFKEFDDALSTNFESLIKIKNQKLPAGVAERIHYHMYRIHFKDKQESIPEDPEYGKNTFEILERASQEDRGRAGSCAITEYYINQLLKGIENKDFNIIQNSLGCISELVPKEKDLPYGHSGLINALYYTAYEMALEEEGLDPNDSIYEGKFGEKVFIDPKFFELMAKTVTRFNQILQDTWKI